LHCIQQAPAAAIELIEGDISFGRVSSFFSGKFGHRLSVIQTFERAENGHFSRRYRTTICSAVCRVGETSVRRIPEANMHEAVSILLTQFDAGLEPHRGQM